MKGLLFYDRSSIRGRRQKILDFLNGFWPLMSEPSPLTAKKNYDEIIRNRCLIGVLVFLLYDPNTNHPECQI